MEQAAIELAKSGGFFWLIVIGVAALVFNAGIAWTQFHYMRTSMVTKKDMEISLLKFKEEMNEEFVTRKECDFLPKHRRGSQFQ